MVEVSGIKVSYDNKTIVEDFSAIFKKGKVTTIIGPNGSGKSTVLKAIAKVIKKDKGEVLFYNKEINTIPRKELAKKLAFLMQTNIAPYNFTVKQLVAYGRVPYQKWYESKDKEHDEIIEWAMKESNIKHLQDRLVSSLSGGERQKVWIALTLAQKPEVLFLDEPTTYLDICHQLEIMQLVKKLNISNNLTVIMVLHDLNQAAQFSDNVLAIKEGKIVSHGCPKKVITKELLEEVYNIEADINFNENINSICITPICIKQCNINKYCKKAIVLQ